MRKLKPQGKVWSERTNSQTNAQMVVSSFDLFKEPMLLLLIAVLFILGQNNEVFHAGRNSSSLRNFFYQDNRSRMEALEKLNEPLSTVLRNGEP
jgi:Ca2+-transporting ATPase